MQKRLNKQYIRSAGFNDENMCFSRRFLSYRLYRCVWYPQMLFDSFLNAVLVYVALVRIHFYYVFCFVLICFVFSFYSVHIVHFTSRPIQGFQKISNVMFKGVTTMNQFYIFTFRDTVLTISIF